MPRLLRYGFLALVVASVLAACSAGPAPSFDPSGSCKTDGRAAGAYPDLEAMVPTTYMSDPPKTLDSGRNCTTVNLGSLASLGISELRFAGGTWSFGAERAAVLAVFRAPGLTASALDAFYTASAEAADRTDITGRSSVQVDGRAGRRLDTTSGERTQTVVVWPATDPDVVNVVITNDLPDARIQDAIDAFGGH